MIFGIISKVALFFNNSPKRQEAFVDKTKQSVQPNRKQKSLDLCKKRSTEHHKTLGQFYDIVVQPLEELKMSQFGLNTDTVTDGCTLLSAITNTQFVRAFVVSWKGLNLVKVLNADLQSRTSDIIKAYRYIDLTKQSTQKARDETDRVNEEWFTVANSMAESVGIDNN